MVLLPSEAEADATLVCSNGELDLLREISQRPPTCSLPRLRDPQRDPSRLPSSSSVLGPRCTGDLCVGAEVFGEGEDQAEHTWTSLFLCSCLSWQALPGLVKADARCLCPPLCSAYVVEAGRVRLWSRSRGVPTEREVSFVRPPA